MNICNSTMVYASLCQYHQKLRITMEIRDLVLFLCYPWYDVIDMDSFLIHVGCFLVVSCMWICFTMLLHNTKIKIKYIACRLTGLGVFNSTKA